MAMEFLNSRFKAYRWILDRPGDAYRNLAWRAFSGKSDWPFVFIFSGPRNGTSLLQLLLGSHSKAVHFDGEAGLHYVTANLMDRQRFSGKFSAEAMDRVYDNSRDFASFVERFYLEQGAVAGETFCVEKVAPTPFSFSNTKRVFPKARFIAMVRDGRDAFCSARENKSVITSTGDNLSAFANSWRKWTERTIKVKDHPSVYLLRYEDLVSQPQAEMQKVMDFIGFPFEPGQIDESHRSNTSKTSRDGFHKLDKPITTSSIGRYKKLLSPAEVEAFKAIAGAQLEEAGYDV